MNIVFHHNGRFWLYEAEEGIPHPAREISHADVLKLCREKLAEYRKGFWPDAGVQYDESKPNSA